jgi:hypothetical protein
LQLEDIPGHDNDTFNPADFCPDGPGGGPDDNETPNLPPQFNLTVTNAEDGTETNVVMLDGSFTFMANGSVDPDGTIEGAAVTVVDSNTTRTKPLWENGVPVPATFKMDRTGVVNVTASMVDNFGNFTFVEMQVYVNTDQTGSQTPHAFHPTHDSCDPDVAGGGSGTGAITNAMSFAPQFDVEWGAQWIEVTLNVAARGQVMAILCSPTGTELGSQLTPTPGANPTTTPFESNPDADLSEVSGGYYILIVNRTPETATTAHVIVHYDPKPAA